MRPYDGTISAAQIYDQIIPDGDTGPCTYCDAENGHAEHCPYISGLWPINAYAIGACHTYVCDGCGEEHEVQLVCARCGDSFEDDDLYRVFDEETGLLVTYAVEPKTGIGICLECAGKQADALRKMLG